VSDIVATISGETSNSYVTLAEATEYFAGRLHASAWESASTADREKALVTACRHVESCRLQVTRRVVGELLSPVVPTQALAFPRYRDVDATSAYIIPQPVKRAQCEEALALLAFGAEQQRRSALQAGGVSSFQVDGLSESYGEGAGSSPLISGEARKLMAPFIARGGVIATSDNPLGEFTPGSGR
jgi:hypothetical protein